MRPFNLSVDALLHPAKVAVFPEPELPELFDTATGFEPLTAWWLAKLSHLSYYPPKQAKQILERTPFTIRAYIMAQHTHCYILTSPGFGLLVFRGTDPSVRQNIQTDLDAWFTNMEAASVHRGFQKAFQALWPKIRPHLRHLLHEKRQLMFTGHSLGGALALLAATKEEAASVYTFGAPRIGNQKTAALMKSRNIYRIENCCDLVPNLPPARLGYQHIGKQLFLNAKRQLLEKPDMSYILEQRARAEAGYTKELTLFRRNKLLNRWLVDHAVVNYAVALREHLPKT